MALNFYDAPRPKPREFYSSWDQIPSCSMLPWTTIEVFHAIQSLMGPPEKIPGDSYYGRVSMNDWLAAAARAGLIRWPEKDRYMIQVDRGFYDR